MNSHLCTLLLDVFLNYIHCEYLYVHDVALMIKRIINLDYNGNELGSIA